MSLRSRTLIITGVTLLGLTAIIFVLSQTVVLSGFEQVEVQRSDQNAERIANTLSSETAALSATTADWSYWDDTYRFIDDLNQDYIDANLADSTLVNLRVNLMLFVNAANQTVYHKAVDLQAEAQAPFPEDFFGQITASSPLLDHNGKPEGDVSGVMVVDGQPLLVASRAILNSERQGPIRGSLIFGRFLNDSEVQAISEALRLPFAVYNINSPQLSAGLRTVAQSFTTESPITTDLINDETLAGYTQLKDIYGQPALLLRVETPRDIYAQGQATISLFARLLLAAGLTFVIVTFLLLERGVLVRVTTLSGEVDRVRASGDLHQRVTAGGSDEISLLELGINEMLSALEQNQQLIHEKNSELMTASRELAIAQEKAEVNRLKGEFLATVSHELRTPLHAIVGYSDLMSSGITGPLSDKQAEYIERILASSDRLLALINQILDLSKIEANQMKITLRPFAPGELLKTVHSQLDSLAAKKNLSLEAFLDSSLPPILLGSSERLEQILVNLVGNAIKFTEHGRVSIRFARGSSTQWTLSVSDTGIGMAPDALNYIFEEFRQVDGTSRRQYGGTGLGLAIVDRLVRLMDGTISVSSEPGAGSTFVVQMPLLLPETKPLEERLP
jgi:signal transduction histidine kinase